MVWEHEPKGKCGHNFFYFDHQNVLKHRRPKLTMRGTLNLSLFFTFMLTFTERNATLALQHLEMLCYNGLNWYIGRNGNQHYS